VVAVVLSPAMRRCLEATSRNHLGVDVLEAFSSLILLRWRP
jgi:hypothetical protein